jgi:hypothetical protein
MQAMAAVLTVVNVTDAEPKTVVVVVVVVVVVAAAAAAAVWGQAEAAAKIRACSLRWWAWVFSYGWILSLTPMLLAQPDFQQGAFSPSFFFSLFSFVRDVADARANDHLRKSQ